VATFLSIWLITVAAAEAIEEKFFDLVSPFDAQLESIQLIWQAFSSVSVRSSRIIA
jgi:hypothetical protein